MLSYGKVTDEVVYADGTSMVEETGYKDGSIASHTKRETNIVRVHNRQQLFDVILGHMEQLQEHDSISFTILADKRTREPYRIDLLTEYQL